MIDDLPRRTQGNGLAVRLPHLATRTHRQPQDTEAGCRARAAANLAEASTMSGHSRGRLEHSAASWTTRADLLGRLDTGARARAAAAE